MSNRTYVVVAVVDAELPDYYSFSNEVDAKTYAKQWEGSNEVTAQVLRVTLNPPSVRVVYTVSPLL